MPILDRMVALYEQPPTPARFQTYLAMLQGNTKGDMVLPIGGYNPMAKPHVLDKLKALQALGAEEIATQAANAWNDKFAKTTEPVFQICLTLADDAQGGWTNRFTTDFDSKFKLNPLISRGFCTPYFWTSEPLTSPEVATRIRAYLYRTVYGSEHPRPTTLAHHLQQEVYVHQMLDIAPPSYSPAALAETEELYQTFAQEEDYNLIFNFFYGDEASASLSFSQAGMGQLTGYTYAHILAGRLRKGE